MTEVQRSRRAGRPRLGEERELAPFGRNLRAALKRSRFKNRAEFVREIGFDQSTLYRYEVGDRDPPVSLVQQFANLLGVSVETLMGGEAPLRQLASGDT